MSKAPSTAPQKEPSPTTSSSLRVVKRDGRNVLFEPERIYERSVEGFYDEMPEREMEQALVLAARSLIEEEPDYTYASARLLLQSIYKEVFDADVPLAEAGTAYRDYFARYVERGLEAGILDPELQQFDLDRLAQALRPERDLHHCYGAAFEERYRRYEEQADRGEIDNFKRVKAVKLWRKMLSMLFETGHPWITFKDPSNARSPQDHAGVVHSSNLCTEILLNTSEDETAVCNLGSVNLVKHLDEEGQLDRERLEETVSTAVRMLDNVIDINFYPTPEAENANQRHRPVGLGVMGFQDALHLRGSSYASDEAVDFADRSMEAVSYYALRTSALLAEERGAYRSFEGSKWDRGLLPVDTIDVLEEERGEPVEVPRSRSMDWTPVRRLIAAHGMRNSNVLAIFRHVTNPECRQYLLRQSFEEAIHTHAFLYIVESLGLDQGEVFNMYREIPAIARKDQFEMELTRSILDPDFRTDSLENMQEFVKNLIGFYVIMEGIFFYSGFAMVLSMHRQNRMRGTGEQFQYILRDETIHLNFGIDLINGIKEENPALWTLAFQKEMQELIEEAVELEVAYAYDCLPNGILGLNAPMFREYVEHVANRRLERIGLGAQYDASNPFPWMSETIDLAKEKNFFETRVTEYQQAASLSWE